MYYPVTMNVFERQGDLVGDLDGALRWELALLIHDLPQQAAFDPLHHHVGLAAVIVDENFHDAGMIEFVTDFLLAMKPLRKHRVGFHFWMRNLDGDGPMRVLVGGMENGSHAAARYHGINQVMVQLVAGVK